MTSSPLKLIPLAIIASFLVVGCSSNTNKTERETSLEISSESDEISMKEQLEAENEMQRIQDSIAAIEQQQEAKLRKERTYTPIKFMEMIWPYYEKNSVSADAKFQGQVYFIKGEISNINRHLTDGVYFNIGMGHPYQNVQCFVDNESSVGNLEIGQQVTARCEYQSIFVGGQVHVNIRMQHCTVVQ